MAESKNPIEESPSVSPKVKAIERQTIIVTAIIALLIIGSGILWIYLSHQKTSFEFIIRLITGVVIPFVVPGVKALFSKKLKAAQLEWDILHGIDPSTVESLRLIILNRTEYLARSIGAKINGLEIDVKNKDKIQAIRTSDNKITLSKRATEELSNDELDFVLAHEIAAIKASRLKNTHLYMILLAISALTYMLWVLVESSAYADSAFPITMAFLLCTFILLLITYYIIMNQDKYHAYYLALKETRNLEAARSAVIKMGRDSSLSGDPDISHDPQVSRRLATLNRIADQIGLLTSSTQRSSFESEG